MVLKNDYQVIDFLDAGIAHVEVHGKNFCHEDLYELSGKHGFMTTFNIKVGSPSHSAFGDSLTGVILYAHNETKESASQEKIKIRCFVRRDLGPEITKELKDRGLSISDIESISYLPLMRVQEFHETGEKKVPGIVNIELGADDLEKIDINKLRQILLIKKDKAGIVLTGFEREELVGIELALNNGQINSQILKYLGFTKEAMKENINIWNSYYDAKERSSAFSESEKQEHKNIKDIIGIERIMKLFLEINQSQATSEELNQSKEILKEIIDSILSFRSYVLLSEKAQVYWDVDSYIHIVMRHFKKYQFGSYKTRTPFCYRAKDLETLIEQVLKVIKEEYKLHVSKTPRINFFRVGKKAVEFNGDYYAIRILPDGRLDQFHAYQKNMPQ